MLSALIVMGNPVCFGAFLGDWSRYIPPATAPRRLLGATFAAQLMTLVPFLFGVATATLVAGEADYVVALINASPLWYAVLLMVVAFLGGLSTGITSLYGTGLDFSSVFPRLSRVQASLFIGALAFVFILVGRLAFDLVASVNAFIGAIVICTTPWMVIMTIGYVDPPRLLPRGRPAGVQPGPHRAAPTGSPSGVNWRGMVAWIPAAVLGLMFANYPPLIEGPFRNVAGGVDLSLLVAIGLAAVVYVALLLAFPEPRYVFGPRGSAAGARRRRAGAGRGRGQRVPPRRTGSGRVADAPSRGP